MTASGSHAKQTGAFVARLLIVPNLFPAAVELAGRVGRRGPPSRVSLHGAWTVLKQMTVLWHPRPSRTLSPLREDGVP
jgi:hypothetical protein